MTHLENDYDAYNDNYDSQYPNYTATQLDSVDDINNFDEFKPLKDFENLFGGYTSKRVGIQNIENNWLTNNFTGTDPDSLDLTYDEFQNTVFNANYSFKIGTDLYQLKSDGIYLNGVNQGGGTGGSYSVANGTVASPMSPPDCFAGRKSAFLNASDGKHRFKVKAAVHDILIRGMAKGKVVAFNQRKGKWKRSRYKMAADCGGNIYTSNCTLEYQNTSARKPSSGFKTRRSLAARIPKWGPGTSDMRFRTKHGEFAAFADFPDGTYTTQVIL